MEPQLTEAYESLEPQQKEAVRDYVYSLCREHERRRFVDGVKEALTVSETEESMSDENFRAELRSKYPTLHFR